MNMPMKAKRTKRTKKPKHKVVTRTFDFLMVVNDRQNDRLWIHGKPTVEDKTCVHLQDTGVAA